MRHRKATAGPGAFSLVELMVGLTLLVVLFTGFWNLTVAGSRSFEDTAAQLAAVRSACVAVDWLRRDLAKMAMARPHPLATKPVLPVSMKSRKELSFPVVSTIPAYAYTNQMEVVATESISYRFIPRGESGAGLYRNGRRMLGVWLERFEADLQTDPRTGAVFLNLTVIGSDPTQRRRCFLRDLVYLEAFHDAVRHAATVPNLLPAVRASAPVSNV